MKYAADANSLIVVFECNITTRTTASGGSDNDRSRGRSATRHGHCHWRSGHSRGGGGRRQTNGRALGNCPHFGEIGAITGTILRVLE